jgi:hypothetical protein
MAENMLNEIERRDADNDNDKCDEEEHHDSFGVDDVKHLVSLFLFDCKYIIANLCLLVNKKPRFFSRVSMLLSSISYLDSRFSMYF